MNDRAPSHAPAAQEQRVSVLVGDRLCTHCGYNLTGQAVLREPHYNLLIVRCPECAAVASVQEYPLLGRWANRWAAVLAGLWIVVLVAIWIGSGAAIFGISVGTAEWAREDYSNAIYTHYQEWMATQPTPQASNFQAWWNQQREDQLIQQLGGWSRMVEWRALLVWVPLALVSIVFGCFWSVALLGQRRGGRLLWGLAVMAVACAFSLIVIADWFDDNTARSYYAGVRQISFPILLMSLAFAGLMLSVGLLIGRSVVRGFVRILLPPRMRSALALLWTADGLPPPAAARALWK